MFVLVVFICEVHTHQASGCVDVSLGSSNFLWLNVFIFVKRNHLSQIVCMVALCTRVDPSKSHNNPNYENTKKKSKFRIANI